MYQSIPTPPIPPGISQVFDWSFSPHGGEFDPSGARARLSIWLSCQNACQRRKQKEFRNSFRIQHLHPQTSQAHVTSVESKFSISQESQCDLVSTVACNARVGGDWLYIYECLSRKPSSPARVNISPVISRTNFIQTCESKVPNSLRNYLAELEVSQGWSFNTVPC